MAFPFGAVAGTLAVVCSHHNKADNCQESYKGRDYEELKLLEERRKDILEYLELAFYATVRFCENSPFDAVIYELEFKDVNIGIQLDYDLILQAPLDIIYRHAYYLVRDELMKSMEKRHIRKCDI